MRLLEFLLLVALVTGYFYSAAFVCTHLLGVEDIIDWNIYPVIPALVSAVLVISRHIDCHGTRHQ